MNNKKYIIDENGKWEVQGIYSNLIEPSESYLERIKLEQQEREEQLLLDSLTPTEKDILKAEIEIDILTLIQEMGVL
jgi:hypothetical protein